MTNSTPNPQIAQNRFVPGSSREPRSIRTLALQMARAEEARARDRGERIKELRGSVPQPRLAERLDVSLRAYQEWEAGGGIAWDNLVKLADVLQVTPEYIEFGVSGRPRPDTDLGRLERKVDALLRHAKIDPAAFDAPGADDGVADIVAAAKGSMEVLGGVAPAKPPAKRAPARKRRAG